MSEVFSHLIEMTLTKWAIPGEIYKLELTAFARLELSQYFVCKGSIWRTYPGKFGTNEIKKATAARQLIPYL